MVRKLIRIALFVFLVYLPISFVVNQFSMRSKLSAVAEKFNSVVDDHEARSVRFSGELNSILVERNNILKQEKNLILGSWNSGFFRTNMILYLGETWWMPNDIYKMMTRFQFDNSATFVDIVFFLFFLFLPIVGYPLGWISVKYLLRKPAQ